MRVLIFGATGLFGRDLMKAFASHTLRGLGSKDADIRDAAQVRAMVKEFGPDWILLPAAQPHVDVCEADPDLAFAVNRDGALNVAAAAQEMSARLLFVSTDYIFDGNKRTPYETTDVRNPINVYGKSKAEAEVLLLKKIPDCCIARVSWLFGTGKQGFPDFILQSAEKGEVRAPVDVNSCPTYTVDAAKAICELVNRGASGIIHVTNQGVCSRYEFAHAVVAVAGLRAPVTPITSDQMPRPAKRPVYSALSGKSLQTYGITLPSWQNGLERYFAERQSILAGSV